MKLVFGYPGGANMPIYDALFGARDRLRHVLVRHEQGAGHAAQGYARATGRPGVCMGTSGPGATNLLTALADALMDSTPLVAITGQVAGPKLGTDAFQEADAVGMSLPGHPLGVADRKPGGDPLGGPNGVRRRPRRHRGAGTRALGPKARAGAPRHHPRRAVRPSDGSSPRTPRGALPTPRGPLPLPRAVPTQTAILRSGTSPARVNRRRMKGIGSTRPRAGAERGGREGGRRGLVEKCNAAARLLNRAERPYLLAGQGVTISGAEAELREVAERGRIPVGLTLLGLSALPSDHPLNVGMLGMHGSYGANLLTNEADVILAVGMRFDDRVTGNLDTYARQARIIHIDVDPAEINKAVPAEVPIAADARAALSVLVSRLRGPEPTARAARAGSRVFGSTTRSSTRR